MAPPDGGRAGEGHHVDARVAGQRGPDRLAIAKDDVDHARGKPASISSSPSITVVEGVSSDGLTTQVQPAASAKGSFCDRIQNGKFQGVMTDTTPIGSFSTTASMSWPRELWLSRAASGQAMPHSAKGPPPADLAPRLGDGLAGFQRLDQGHALDIGLDQVGDLQQNGRAGLAGQAAPPAIVKGARAAAMAASASALPPLAARLTTTPCDGDSRSETAPSALSCQRRRSGGGPETGRREARCRRRGSG
jgi:hypothetical protein